MLKELQLVADSADSLKRNRGRRGLDILQKIQKMSGVDVMISDIDFPEVREVDLKLIELGRTLQGKIVTNDFNLNKVAQLRGVEVLNINELANALKPVVLPGEFMKVFILKEGKEYNQGVAYLDDGTMVVVDNARRMISKNIDIVVTSVLQTTAGKMIFGRYIEGAGASRRRAAPRGRRRRRPPAAAAACRCPTRNDSRAAIPLVADGLLSDPRGQRLHDRARHGLAASRRSFDRSGDFGHRCARAWSWLILKTTGVRVQVDGLERLDPARSYVFAANHQSIYDIPIVFASLPFQLRIIAKESLGRIPVPRLAPAADRAPARRSTKPGRRDREEDGEARAASAHSLIVFPEGTRSVDGTVGAVQGRHLPARDRPALPIVPVSIAGSRHVMPKGRLMVVPGDVTVTVHAPIDDRRR